MGSSTRPSAAAGGGISQGGSFHYLNAQKRILREYAKNHLGLGVRWRSSLRGVKSYRGVRLDVTPSSQWTQEELDSLYAQWGLDRPSPEELRAKTCMTVLIRDGAYRPPLQHQGRPSPPAAPPRYTQPRRLAAQRNVLVKAEASDGWEDMALDEEEDEDRSYETNRASSNTSSPSHRRPAGERKLTLSSSSLSSLSLQGGHGGGTAGTRNTSTVYYGESDTDSTSDDGEDTHLHGPSHGCAGSARTTTATNKPSAPSATGAGRVATLIKSTSSAGGAEEAGEHDRVVTMDDLLGEFGVELLPYLGFGEGTPGFDGVEGEEQQALPSLFEWEQMDMMGMM